VTVRLDPDLREKLQRYGESIGIDLSTVIRQAISQLLAADSTAEGKTTAEMPAEALALTGPYQVWGSDLKEKLRESFLRILAMAYVTTRRWPKTAWVRQLYLALLPLYQCLEPDNVRQSSK
jgi:hypothetical protein